MQITQTVSEDLRRQFTVTVPASELDSRVTKRLEEMKPRVNLKGFRPGKAPVSFLKKQFGKSLMGEVVEQARQRRQPEGDQRQPAEARAPAARRAGGRCAAGGGRQGRSRFTVTVDLMPDFETADVSKLKVERLIADVTDADVDEALERLAKQSRTYRRAPKARRPRRTTSVVIDFVGSIDGVEFEGGKGEDFNLTLGSGQFIPGFEDQLIGAKAGEARDVKVTFPADYHAAELAGKDAVFAVTVKEVKAPEDAEDRRRAGQEAGPGRSRHAQGPGARAGQGRFQRAPAACI